MSETMTRKGVLKWYSQTKRYGFVRLEDSEQEALLHESALNGFDVNQLVRGVQLECECAQGEKGLNVQRVVSLTPGEQIWVAVKCKWFNKDRGYGFVVQAPGMADIFIHKVVLRTGGMVGLIPNQEVYVLVTGSSKGPMATAVKVAA